jgi:hypothetical protein
MNFLKRVYKRVMLKEKYWLPALTSLAAWYFVVRIAGANIPVVSAVVLNSFVYIFPVCLFYIILYRLLNK